MKSSLVFWIENDDTRPGLEVPVEVGVSFIHPRRDIRPGRESLSDDSEELKELRRGPPRLRVPRTLRRLDWGGRGGGGSLDHSTTFPKLPPGTENRSPEEGAPSHDFLHRISSQERILFIGSVSCLSPLS